MPLAFTTGLALLLAHALYKCTLFLVIGLIDHRTGTRDLRRLSGLGREMPLVTTVTALALASMIGLPPLLGFAAKESALKVLQVGLRADTREVEVDFGQERRPDGWASLAVTGRDGSAFAGWWRRDGVFLLTLAGRRQAPPPLQLPGGMWQRDIRSIWGLVKSTRATCAGLA